MGQKQLLRDATITPTDKVLAKELGPVYKTFHKFVDELKDQNITLMNWRYYNDGKAWLTKGEYKWTTPRGANKVKPIFGLSIWEGFFKVSFFFALSMQAELQNLPITQTVKKSLSTTKILGKTIRFFPVILDIKTDKQLEDVYTIAEYKRRN